MNKLKLLTLILILLLIGLSGIYGYASYVSYKNVESEYEKKLGEVSELEKKLDKLEKSYEEKIASSYNEKEHSDIKRIQSDVSLLNKVLKPCFEFTNSDEYNSNRERLYKISPKDCSFFTDYLVKNDDSLDGFNIDVSGLKMKCDMFKVYPTAIEGEYSYYVVLGYLPYINNDDTFADKLDKHKLILFVKMDSSGKKIKQLDCYKADDYV